jgi:lipopolysaccharide/colanic/teichoic acid biosynthesis glycosyltransferase
MKPWIKKLIKLLVAMCGLSLLCVLMIQLKKESLDDSQGDLQYFEKIVESRKEIKVIFNIYAGEI